jgi:hypothetical protein
MEKEIQKINYPRWIWAEVLHQFNIISNSCEQNGSLLAFKTCFIISNEALEWKLSEQPEVA